jgi:hypothetical protein
MVDSRSPACQGPLDHRIVGWDRVLDNLGYLQESNKKINWLNKFTNKVQELCGQCTLLLQGTCLRKRSD